MDSKIDSNEFYSQYHGHSTVLLEAAFTKLVDTPRKSGQQVRVVFLCGDSSMDNKYWIKGDMEPAVNGYETILRPKRSVPDVCHQLNKKLAEIGACFVCFNCAVEESTIGVRKGGKELLIQDEFIRSHITEEDVLICSVGGNDIALKPTASTIVSVGWMSLCSSTTSVRSGDAWGLGHLRELFGKDLAGYLNALICRRKPALIVPAVIYYPDMNNKQQSWSNSVLSAIGYNKDPQHIHALIDRVVVEVEKSITASALQGVPTKVVALSKALDGTVTTDYVARVEPSATGGEKIASLFLSALSDAGFV